MSSPEVPNVDLGTLFNNRLIIPRKVASRVIPPTNATR
jgi:hypothetical protein